MRISPKNLSPAEALSKAKSKMQARSEGRHEIVGDAPDENANESVLASGSIDAGRAQRLLERAVALAGRGDMGAAILATRQSLALAPESVEAHLLNARLLERNRDFGGARAAYEKSAQLAPDRADARENLARLDAYLEKSAGAARQFHFDSDELFAPADESETTDSVPQVAPATPATSGEAVTIAPVLATPQKPVPAPAPASTPASELDMMALMDESMLPSVEARLPPTRAEIVASIAPEAAIENGAPAQSELITRAEASDSQTRESVARQDVMRDGVAPAAEDRRKHNIPVATERRRRPAVAALSPVVVAAAAPVAGSVTAVATQKPVAVPLRPAPAKVAANPFGLDAPVAPPQTVRAPLTLDVPAAAPTAPLWQQVIARPSFYARTLPLVGVALLSLGFLSWARGRAVSQVVAPASTELASADFAPDAGTADAPGASPSADNAGQSGVAAPNAAPARDASGFPISNAPIVFQAPAAQNASAPDASASAANRGSGASNGGRANNRGNSAPSTTARASNRGFNGGGNRAFPNQILPPARPVPRFPGVSLAPAPISPSSVISPNSSTPRGDNGNNILLPSPNIALPEAAAPRQRVLPPTDNGLNPAGSPNRGYARVTEGRVGNGIIPSQPSAVARDNERAANDAARNGQNDQAISQLSQAIRADSDNAGFRYQQRAMLFLQRGDYNRASDDFQSAVSAYQTQINNGDDVAGAKRGLSSARSGLSLALAGRRG